MSTLSQTPGQEIYEGSYITATAVVNEIPPSLNWLDQLLFGEGRTIMTEDFEIIVVSDTKAMAPYIKPGTRPPQAAGVSYTIGTYKTPMIGEERPFPMGPLMLERKPGSSHYAGPDMSAAAREHVGRELQQLRHHSDNREEWQAASLLDKTISYTNTETEAFTITYPSTVSTITLSSGAGWDDIDFTSFQTVEQTKYNTDPALTFDAAARSMNEAVRVTPTDCIMGITAAQRFLQHPTVKKDLDVRRLDTGDITRQTKFNMDGARYLGRYCSVDCWEYAGQVEADAGGSEYLVEEEAAYFIHVGPAAQFDKVYGLIPNWKLATGNVMPSNWAQIQGLQGVPARRFADVYGDMHGNSLSAAYYSRPLPVLRRPDCIVKADVIS